MLLLGEPASLRFEALSPFGTPVLIVAGDPQSRHPLGGARQPGVHRCPPRRTPTGGGSAWRWAARISSRCSRGAPDRCRTRPGWSWSPPTRSARRSGSPGADVEQRIWFDPASGQAKQVEWTGKNPARVTFTPTPPDAPPAGLRLETPDGSLRRHGGLPRPADEHGARPRAAEADCPGTRENSRLPLTLSTHRMVAYVCLVEAVTGQHGGWCSAPRPK